MTFIDNATRYLFFTGKAAWENLYRLCERGRPGRPRPTVLIVSTDPASNLDAVLGVALSSQPTPIDAVPQLFALNIDPQMAATEYRERLMSPYRAWRQMTK
jgi:arsenite-transporting ATPase